MFIDPYYHVNLGIIDLLLISFIEIAFIWFFFPKESIRKIFPLVCAINLIKLGVISFVCPIIPSFTYGFEQILAIEFCLLFVLGIIVSTIIYEKEEWAASREQAGALAFRITTISSLIWFIYKSLQSYPYYYFVNRSLVTNGDYVLTNSVMTIPFSDVSITFFGPIIIILGLIILSMRYKRSSFRYGNYQT